MRIADHETIDLDAESPPSSGSWLDPHDDALDGLSPDEAAAGERLGELIDLADDDDTGLQYLGGDER